MDKIFRIQMSAWGAWLISFFILMGFHIPSQPLTNGLIFFISSLIPPILGLWMSYHFKIPEKPGSPKKIQWVTTIILAGMLLTGIIALIPNYPIDVKRSDIIPQIQVLVRRFLQGDFPYQTLS